MLSSTLLSRPKARPPAGELTKESISQLRTQAAALTSAVAETYSKEDKFKLRICNLEGVIKTKAVVTGDAGPRRANKETRETEHKQGCKKIGTAGPQVLRKV